MRFYILCIFLTASTNFISSEEISVSKISKTPDDTILYPYGYKISNLNATHTSSTTKKPSISGLNEKPFIKLSKPAYLLDNRNDLDVEVVENILESQILEVKDPLNLTHQQLVAQPHRGNVVDWFLGIIGIRPPGSTPPPVTVPPLKDCPSCKCGQVLKHKRIVGGVETVINGYPWMTALMYNNRFYCGGSLINNKYVLTAAHCVNGFSSEKLSVVFLDHDRSSLAETYTITRKIKNVYRHSLYGHGGNYNNDIALLQLDKDVPVTGLLKPVCLPATGRSFTGLDGIAVGWGATKEHGSISNKLLEVTVPILSNIDCRKTGYGPRITDNMLCAGFPQGMKDSCQGDSGGPLHVVNGSFHQVVGIVSWGEGCAKPNYPGVYTRVNKYVTWIKSNTRDACYCTN